VKFFLRDTDAGKVIDVLKTNCRPAASHPSSRVTSIYFDDPGFRSYDDNLEGTGERVKIRLRWYDSDEERFFFETKRRSFSKTIKERVALESPAPLTSLFYRETLKRLQEVLPEPHRGRLLAAPHPILITRYQRSYFSVRDGSVRVTLDSCIEWYEQCGRSKPSLRFPARIPRLAILEVKTEKEDTELGGILYPLRLRPTRSSKYGVGCRELGLVADSRGGLG
jgi:SPX domain protein involved in polyphosphate accumulation